MLSNAFYYKIVDTIEHVVDINKKSRFKEESVKRIKPSLNENLEIYQQKVGVKFRNSGLPYKLSGTIYT